LVRVETCGCAEGYARDGKQKNVVWGHRQLLGCIFGCKVSCLCVYYFSFACHLWMMEVAYLLSIISTSSRKLCTVCLYSAIHPPPHTHTHTHTHTRARAHTHTKASGNSNTCSADLNRRSMRRSKPVWSSCKGLVCITFIISDVCDMNECTEYTVQLQFASGYCILSFKIPPSAYVNAHKNRP
jgi:hypothetical protein